MKVISFNIGYTGLGNSGILSYHPFVWHDCDFKNFAKKIRQKQNIKQLFKWSKLHHVPPSTITLFITIIEDDWEWSFTIKMISVREFKKHWNEIYKTI